MKTGTKIILIAVGGAILIGIGYNHGYDEGRKQGQLIGNVDCIRTIFARFVHPEP